MKRSVHSIPGSFLVDDGKLVKALDVPFAVSPRLLFFRKPYRDYHIQYMVLQE